MRQHLKNIIIIVGLAFLFFVVIQELVYVIIQQNNSINFSHTVNTGIAEGSNTINPDWGETTDVIIDFTEYYIYNTRFCSGSIFINEMQYNIQSQQFYPRSLFGKFVGFIKEIIWYAQTFGSDYYETSKMYCFTTKEGDMLINVNQYWCIIDYNVGDLVYRYDNN